MTAATRSLSRMPMFLRFLACGGIAALANWASRFIWSLFLPFTAAVAAAYATGMVVAFYLFRTHVFASDRPMAEQAHNFCLVNLIGMGATVLVARLLVEALFPAIDMRFHPQAIGHALAILAPVATSWIGHRLLTFR